MSDLELLKVYLQEQIDTTGNKKFVFKECNAIEFRLTDAINEINELEEKDKEIEKLNKIIQIKQNRINKLNKKLIRRDNIIEDLKAILKSKGYETYIPILERSDKE